MDGQSTRRRFLRVSGTAAAGLTFSISGCQSGIDNEEKDDQETGDTETSHESNKEDDNDSESPDLPDNGAVVFVYDDGPIEDYTQAFPVHQEFDAPATTGIITERIGRENYLGTDWMDIEQLEELTDAGWELASHTVEHTAVGTFDLVEDISLTDKRIYPEEIRHGYHRGKIVELTNNREIIQRIVTDYGSDDIGQYIELNKLPGESFKADETVIRYPEDQMHESLRKSKRKLEGLGFKIDTLLAPYDNFDQYSQKFVTEYYDGVANARHGSRINNPGEFDPYQTHRDYFIEFTDPKSVKKDFDKIAEHSALGVIGAHTFKEEVTKERIYKTLEGINERGIEVMTLREAITRFADGSSDD